MLGECQERSEWREEREEGKGSSEVGWGGGVRGGGVRGGGVRDGGVRDGGSEGWGE